MGHSANTFWERAAVYEALKRHVSDERAIEVLDELVTEEVARARELEVFAAQRSSTFASSFVFMHPSGVAAIALSESTIN